MTTNLVFGWRTAILLVAEAQMLILASAIARASVNLLANRCLAALLIVLAGILTPDMIGFAGFYDTFPWLSFPPFAVPLAVGPLLYFYSHALSRSRFPKHAVWHLAPAIAQFAYQAVSFFLPLTMKGHWDDISSPIASPIITLGVIVGLSCYCVLSLQLLLRYRLAVAEMRSDDERYAARWLSRAVIAMLMLLAAWSAYDACDLLVARLDYFGSLGLYLIIAAVGCFLGVEGWRHADRRFPAIDLPIMPPSEERPTRDWAAIMSGWSTKVREGRWYEDPQLSLPVLARLLGTNSTYLSRAINEGLGVSFSNFIAGLRCEAVATALRAGSDVDLLTLTFDAGFGSKASFNRAFQTAYGESPSAYRRRHASHHK